MFMGFINFLLRKFTSTVKKLNDFGLKKFFFMAFTDILFEI
jgi:hypothetical protein